MKVGQLRDLRGDPRAAFALLRRRVAGVPHEVVGDQLSTALEHVEKRHLAVRARRSIPGAEPFGVLAPGNRADLVLTGANPLDGLATLHQPWA